MKSKIFLILSIFLLPLLAIGAINGDKGDGVVLTPHQKVSLLPAPNIIHPQVPLSIFDATMLRGNIAYGDNLQFGNLYYFDIDDPSVTTIVGNVGFMALCGDFRLDDPDHIWIIDYIDEFLKRINLTTLLVIDSVAVPCPLDGGIWSGLPIHKGTGQIYGIATNSISSVLYEINPFDGAVTELLIMDITAVISASFDMEGMLYVFDIDTDGVFMVDIPSSTTTLLGPAGFDGNYAQGMGLDMATNQVYFAAYVDSVGSQLRLLDKFTGLTTLIASLPGETGAFGFPYRYQPQLDFISSGIDQWMSPGADITFGPNGDMPPIPADFFGPGSEPFEGQIGFHGRNSGGGQLPLADVLVERSVGGLLEPPDYFVNIPIQIIELNLKSIEPIQVGVDSFFDVFFEIEIGGDQFGNDFIMREDPFGGTFTTDLMFYPVFTFIEVDNPANVLVFNPEYPLMYYTPQPYSWTFNPIPGDFDPIGEEPMVLQTEMGGELELLPFLSRDDYAFLMMNEEGIAVEWEGTGYNNGEWYEYPNYGWWNVWLYDHPYDNARNKIISATFDIQPYNPELPVDVTIVYNWSTGNWTGWPEVPRPPLPEDVPTIEIEDEMIGRSEPLYQFQGTIGQREVITNEFVIEDFNPEWLSIDVMGSNFILNANINHVCFKEYSEPVIEGGILKVGDWLVSEEWHRWIGNDKDETKVEFYPESREGILYVDFYYSLDGLQWTLFDSDDDGVTGMAPGPLPPNTEEMDGWSGYLNHDLLPAQNADLLFRAQVFAVDSFFDVFTELTIEWDVTPPSSVTTNLYDFIITEDPYILLEVLPENANIAYIEVNKEPKDEYFEKGIPPAQQAPGSMDCGPTALAACLKYFEANGHPNVCGGYNLAALIEFLKNYCKTNPETGTWDTDLEAGVRKWIEENGGGFSVRKIPFDWQTMRNELERCQDIITLFNWQDANGDWHGHFMTFNSVSNVPEPDGRIKFDFMDPSTGENIDGYVNPETGEVDGLTDSQGNYIIPDGAEIFSTIIICPEESSINPGTGTIIPGPTPVPYPIPLDSTGMYWIRIQIIDDDGNKSRLDIPIEYVEVTQPVDDLFLAIGDWVIPDPTTDWIGGIDGESIIQLYASDPDHRIVKVDFSFSIDYGETWTTYYTDLDGAEPESSTVECEVNDGDGWTAYFTHEQLPAEDIEVFFRAEATLLNGEVLTAENMTVFDPTPPDAVEFNVEDWMIIEDGKILLQIDPKECLDIDKIWFQLVPKVDTFAKGIPLISQRQHSDSHCTPTSAAACLKYFELQGDTTIAGGYTDHELVDWLAWYMRTNNGHWGTYISDLANGLRRWVVEHGNNYTVRKKSYNWKTMRNELERCQDVLSFIKWTGMDCGHSMTFNSIVNTPVNGLIRVDFMDPWTGEIEYGWINPQTGFVTGLTGAGQGGSGTMGDMVIVCPREPAAFPPGGQVVPGPFPGNPIQILVPNGDMFWLRIIVKDASSHIARTDLVLKSDALDFGDAPDDTTGAFYPTLLANNGARHDYVQGIHLGATIDAELDGQPDFAAVGDDNNPNPKDEDGVQFLTSIVPGQTTNIKVNASVDGYLNAWLDFDLDFDWTGEQIFTDKFLFAGDNYISFAVPASAIIGTTYARFRFTTYQGVPFDGPAENGEVEDYLVEIVPLKDKSKMHFVQWPDLTTNGVDVNCMNDIVVADDFMCTETGKITDIHLWASWLQDNIPEIPPSFKLGIWSDNPMGQNGHSEPDSLLCEFYFNPADYTWEDYADVPDGEWFYNPLDVNGTFPGDWTVYKYNFYIPEDMACHQDSGKIYWLSVNAISDLADNQFGWKTSMSHFNDFATWQHHPINPPWNMLCYPLNHPLENECADMAFYISGPADTTLSHNIYIKDCGADVGIVPSIPPCASLCAGPDIWVDNNSDGIMDNPVVGISNRLYIRARNNGPGTASPVTSSLYFRNCATGLTFPTGATFIGSVTGLSIPSGGTGIGWVPWTVPAPPATYGHWCLGGLVSSPTDPFIPDVPSQMDDNTCFVNIQSLYSRAGLPVPPKDAVAEPAIVEFYFANPFAGEGNFTLDAEITLPVEWILEFFMDGIQIDLPYSTFLLPGEERLIMMIATPPEDAQAGQGGTVIVKQYLEILDVDDLMLIGDITYPITVDLFQPEAISDLEAFKNGDINTLQWTPITHDVAGNEDNIACYNVYKGDTPDFEPEPDNRVGRVAVDENDDEPGFQWYENLPTKANAFYIVRVEDEAGYESENSNVAAILDFVMDFGDAPDPTYPTLAANSGAFHLMDGATYLGLTIDPEFDGQPDPFATGDDLNDLDDEDGVLFNPIMTGSPALVTVTTSSPGFLQGWMDFNGDGDWDDSGEQIFIDEYIHFAYTVCLNYMVPADAKEGVTFARFRFATYPGIPYFDGADNGEVEDYMVEIFHDQGYKWMQEPCPELPGIHCHDEIILGEYFFIVGADDWQCNGGLVTDIHWWGNYEDPGLGIDHFHLSIHLNDPASCLPMPQEIWGIDVPFTLTNETNTGLINSEDGIIYQYEYVLDVPFEQIEGETYWLDISAFSIEPNLPAIWRWQESDRSTVPILCAAATSTNYGLWSSVVWNTPPPPRYSDMAFAITSVMEDMDFGDAPDDPYPTLLASDGARHLSDGVIYLGTKIDVEPDGQPTVGANGDDMNNLADEDGVVFRTPLAVGQNATLKVLASVDGVLNVWLDANRNGSWADGGDHVFINQNLIAGWNTLILNVPANAVVGNTYMRFRFDSQGGLNYYGLAQNGEVEDYLVKVYPENWGHIPTPVMHTILVPLTLIQTAITLQPNDAIGVFYSDGGGALVCGGAAIWDGTNNQVVLAYGNDNTTPQKDGFDDGEDLTWKVFHTGIGSDYFVSVSYDPAMPQSDGKFTSYGLSALSEIFGLSVVATASPGFVCAGDLVQLDVIITGGSGNFTYSWTSIPPGFISGIKNPTDMPNQDITYHVTVTDGAASASSSVDVSVQPQPVAVAGADATICDTDTYDLNGTATNYSSVLWVTAGDGVFNNPNISNPTYYPGVDDKLSGSVELTFIANPINPCTDQAYASLILTIQPSPVADAGSDDSVCAGESFVLLGSSANASSVLWETNGDGTFDDSGILSPIYTPGTLDMLSGLVELCMTAFPVAPCQDSHQDCILLTILETQTVHLFQGWNGLSAYLTPYNAGNNYLLFDPVIGNLIVVYNFGGAFWPGNTNTLNWVDHSGYVAKMLADDDMLFCGDRISNLVINLNPNWNIIPVLSDHDVDVTSVFDNQVDFKIVMEVAHYNMYWPAYGINTLGDMESGKSYFVFMNSADAVDFGNASPKTSPFVPHELVNTSPWNDVVSSPAGHVVAFSAGACSNFKPGDMVGAFTSSGLCAGMINMESQAIGLHVNGDDPYTAQLDGFANDETMTYRLYRPESGGQFNLSVVYDDKLDHSGLYHDFAMSAIIDVKMAPTGIQSIADADIRIYPNPSHGIFNVDGISSETEIMVYDAFGGLIYSKTTHKPMAINLSDQPAGIYLIQIKTLVGTHYQKIIIN